MRATVEKRFRPTIETRSERAVNLAGLPWVRPSPRARAGPKASSHRYSGSSQNSGRFPIPWVT
jgi:hypothetical protein